MRFKKFIYKKKKENFFLSTPFLGFGLQALSSAARSPSSPLPRSAQPPLSAQQPRASASPAPGNCRAQPLTPGPHLSEPPPSSRAFRNRSGGHAATARAPLAHRGRAPPLPGRYKKAAEPPLARPLLPPLHSRLVPAATAARRSPADHRPRRPRRRRLRAVSVSDFRPW